MGNYDREAKWWKEGNTAFFILRTLGQELSCFYRNQNYLFELDFNMFNIFQIFLTLKFGKRIKQVESRLKACCTCTCNINVQPLAIYKNKCQMWALSAEQTTKKPQQGLNQQCLGNTGSMPMTIEPCVSFLNDEPFLVIIVLKEVLNILNVYTK